MYINLNNISILIKGTCIADFPETFILPILNLLLSFCLISLVNYDYMLQYFVSWVICLQGSRWREIWAKKSPCEGWLRFLVGQKQSSSRLVILKSRPMSPTLFMKMLISCLLKSIISIKYFESDFLGNYPLRFIKTLISFIRGFVYCIYIA